MKYLQKYNTAQVTIENCKHVNLCLYTCNVQVYGRNVSVAILSQEIKINKKLINYSNCRFNKSTV